MTKIIQLNIRPAHRQSVDGMIIDGRGKGSVISIPIDRAIDTSGLITDQRNFPRPRDGSWDNVSDMDIGSFEADYPTPP